MNNMPHNYIFFHISSSKTRGSLTKVELENFIKDLLFKIIILYFKSSKNDFLIDDVDKILCISRKTSGSNKYFL